MLCHLTKVMLLAFKKFVNDLSIRLRGDIRQMDQFLYLVINLKKMLIICAKIIQNKEVLIYFVKSFTKMHSYIVKLLTIGYTHLWILCEQ